MPRTRHSAFTPPAEGKPLDMRDAAEHAAVQGLLAALPGDHPVRVAYAHGSGTIALTHLVADHPELASALAEAFLAGYRRSLERWGSHFRP